METPAKTFEDRLQSVQEIINDIETGKLTLEDSVKQYETGIRELNALDAELNEITRRLTVLQQGKDGEPEEKPAEDLNENL